MASLLDRVRAVAGRRIPQTLADRLARWPTDPEMRRRLHRTGGRFPRARAARRRPGP